jgi:hypothetical protein
VELSDADHRRKGVVAGGDDAGDDPSALGDVDVFSAFDPVEDAGCVLIELANWYVTYGFKPKPKLTRLWRRNCGVTSGLVLHFAKWYLGVADACTDEIYAARDWLADRHEAIETKLAATHLAESATPSRMALLDLTSSWVTDRRNELAFPGYSRDGKKGFAQIECVDHPQLKFLHSSYAADAADDGAQLPAAASWTCDLFGALQCGQLLVNPCTHIPDLVLNVAGPR